MIRKLASWELLHRYVVHITKWGAEKEFNNDNHKRISNISKSNAAIILLLRRLHTQSWLVSDPRFTRGTILLASNCQQVFIAGVYVLFMVGLGADAPIKGGTLAPLACALAPHVPMVTSSSAAVG